MQTCAFKPTVASKAQMRTRASSRVVCMANFDAVKKAAAGFGVGVASLALTGAAFAGATVKLGADNGTRFEDSCVFSLSR